MHHTTSGKESAVDRTFKPRFSVSNIVLTGAPKGIVALFDLRTPAFKLRSCRYIVRRDGEARIAGPSVIDKALPSGWRELVEFEDRALQLAVLKEVDSQLRGIQDPTGVAL